MKRTQLINVICSLILASILVLGVLITVIISSSGEGALVIKSDSAQREYNGSALERHYFEIMSGKLKNGHSVQATFSGSQTEIGTSENTFSVKIVDRDGKDVTSRYEIELAYGKLNVLPIEITIETPWAEKAYDGTPLVRNEWSYKGSLLPGHRLNVTVVGSQTEIGSSPNAIDRYAILDANGYDVSRYYNVSTIIGDLVVYDPVQMGGSVGGGSSIDLSGQIGGAINNGEDVVCLKVLNDVDDIVYLKLKSFGAYTGKSWTEAIPYDVYIDGLYSPDYLASLSIRKTHSYIEISSYTDQYFLPYYMSSEYRSNYIAQKSDVMYNGKTDTVYSLYYCKFDYQKELQVPLSYETYELNYREFVKSQYLTIDNETLDYMMGIIEKEKFHNTDLRTILKVAEYIQNSAEYKLDYDRALDAESNVAVAFLETYKEGICQHYATAATLLYRAMGIPARYTVGFMAETVGGQWVDVMGSSAHAWVEVYIDGMGWIQVEVTGGYSGSGNGGGGGNVMYEANITPVSVEKLYDGTPLYAENLVDGFEKYEKLGFTYKAVVSGTRTELGKSSSIIESFTVYDPYGNDATSKFKLNFKEGTIHVYLEELVFESQGHTKEYDSYVLETDLSTCHFVSGKLRAGEWYEISNPMSIVNAMTIDAGFKVTIRDAEGNDVTDIYKITKNCGILKITPREITVKASDATKTYDGYPLTDGGFGIEGELAYMEYIVCTVTGSQTSVGRSDNIVTGIQILNAMNEDVTGNYIVKLETGTLRVTP